MKNISKKQIQPASLDLRLGNVAYRVRASFLPGPGVRVEKRLKSFKMHEIDLTHGAVLEKGCVYVIPLCETLRLKKDISGLVNPKSSAGRLDIFTRVISDGTLEFDTIGAGYKGPIYAEIIPLTFSVKVRSGTTLSQLRLRKGAPPPFETDMRRLHESSPLIGAANNSEVSIKKTGVAFTVDLEGDGKDKLIGYKAKNHAGVIDVDKINHYEPLDFWDPIYKTKENRLILDIDEFIGDGSTGEFLTNISFTQYNSSLITVNGKEVEHVLVEAGPSYAKPGNFVIKFAEPPAGDAVIRYAIFEGQVQNYSSVTIDTFGYVAENTGTTQDDSGVGLLTTFKF